MRLFVGSDNPDGGMQSVVSVSIDRADATVADLARALSLPDTALVIDGIVHLGEVQLGEVALVEGSSVSALGPGGAVSSGMGRSWVGVVSGPEAGAVRRMDSEGSVTIGRGPFSDLQLDNTSVSLQHAEIVRDDSGMSVRDLDSTNGTWVNGALVSDSARLAPHQSVSVGSSKIEFFEVDTSDKPLGTSASHASSDGRVLFNRSPRGPVPAPPAPVPVPEALPERKNPKLALASLLVPILMAAVLVAVLGSWRFALFALLSPLMVLGNWLSNRREVQKERSGDAISRRDALQRLRRGLTKAQEVEKARRAALGPDQLEIRRRVELPSARLWERRLHADDALTIRVGRGDVPWVPADVGEHDPDETDPEVLEILAKHSSLEDVEVLADLRNGPLGLVGDESETLQAARAAILQLATHHGPADLPIAIITSNMDSRKWEWSQWLPHMATTDGGVRIVAGKGVTQFASGVLDELSDDGHGTSRKKRSSGLLLVVDDLKALHKKSSPIRELLARTDQNVFGIVLAPVADRLPASVSTVVTIDSEDGEFERTEPSRPEVRESGIIDGVGTAVAADIARSMARFDDPEAHEVGGSVPTSVTPDELMAEDVFAVPGNPEAIRERWKNSKQEQKLVAPIGLSESGVFAVDLVEDGPHGLVAGTTGAGKSEFLRTFVLGLASNHDPDDLVFVLIDYKGGSAFDRCALLPHVVGFVTDLDDHLAERALQSLEAELHHRETVLRESGSSDISEYRAAGTKMGPLPRLVVVIDEFATMRNELPEFVSSLVGIAQRGRSLGVHLILATQRPSGAVDANIRANTNLRVALRVQTAGDSTDVIDDSGAALIDRSHHGRCLVRRGEGDLVTVQTAYVSGLLGVNPEPIRLSSAPVNPTPTSFPEITNMGSETHMDHLVELCVEAASEMTPARRPWLEELSEHIHDPQDMADLDSGDDAHVVLAVADDPKNQRRVTRGWNLDDGHLGVVGGPGSGVTTTLRSAITALGTEDDREVWVFPVDHGAGGLVGIDEFDHVAKLIPGSDIERQERLLQFLDATLAERRSERSTPVTQLPLIVVAIDGIGSFAEANEIASSSPNGDLLHRLTRDGPAVGLFLLIGAGSFSEVPRMIRVGLNRNVVLEQADERAYADMGIKVKSLPSFVPGRALLGAEAMVAQVVDWETAFKDGAVKVTNVGEPPSIEVLSSDVLLADLPKADVGLDLVIPFGISDTTRTAAKLSLRAGEHCLIAGPSRSGRTNAMQVLAAQLRAADPDMVLVGVANGASPSLFVGEAVASGVFDAGGSESELEHLADAATTDDRRWVIFVDDADRIPVEGGWLVDFARSAPSNVSIVASVRSASARQTYGHWTRFIRSSGKGILLEPDPVADGELLGVRLPRRRLEPVAGRGYHVFAGEAEVVQVAR